MAYRAGRPFLQIPGPTNVPPAVLEAMARPTLDHRGPEFAAIAREVLDRIRQVFKTTSPVIVYPSSGSGAWEAALSNLLVPGDQVLMFETGHFAALWAAMAKKLGFEPVVIEGDWRGGAQAGPIGAALAADRGGKIKALCVVHNETSTGATSDIAAIRREIDRIGHPALLLVDTISSLASIDYRHDEWGVDVSIGCSQKGLMLPPGLGFNAVGPRALDAHRRSASRRSYWDWTPMLAAGDSGAFPYTPASNLLVGLRAALDLILDQEGLDQVFARHTRLAEAARHCVQAWGLEFQCASPSERSNSVTAVRLPEGASADRLRATLLENYGVSLGNGLGRLADRVFRIGHLGDFNEAMLLGTLGTIELGLRTTGLASNRSGLDAAITFLTGNS